MAKFQIRRDTSANFTSVNPILSLGELSYESDTRVIKVGDGSTRYNSLSPIQGTHLMAPAATGSDQRADLQAGINSAAFLGIPFSLNGAHKVNGSLSIPSGAVVDGTHGSLTQLASLTPTILIAGSVSKIRLRNIVASGPMGDYVNNSSVYGACGVRLSTGANNVVIEGCDFTFAGGGIYMFDATVSDIHIRNCKIKGPGSTYITSTSFNYSFGIGNNGGVVNWSAIGNDISGFSQGIVTGDGQQDVRIYDNYVHDIPGQHGIYCDSGDGMHICRNIVRNTGLLGMKIQIGASSSAPADGVIISHNQFINVGAQGILITPGGSGTSPGNHQRIIVSHNIIRGTVAGHGIQVSQATGVIVQGNIINSPSASGISIDTGCVGIEVRDNRIFRPGQNGIVVLDSSDWTLSGNRIIAPGQAVVAVAKNGISITQTGTTTDGTIRDNKITDTTSKMQYGIAVFAGDQANLDFINNVVSGAVDYGARFLASITPRTYRNNSFAAGSLGTILNPPTISGAGPAIQSPADYGLLGASFSPELAIGNQTALTPGTLYTVRVPIGAGGAISALDMLFGGAGTTLSNSFVGVYADGAGGALLASSADISTLIGTGEKIFTLASPTASLAPGTYVRLAIMVGSGSGAGPILRGINGAGFATVNGVVKYGSYAGGYTTLPSTLPAIITSSVLMFVACK